MSPWTSATKKNVITYANDDDPSQTITIINENGTALIECTTGDKKFFREFSGNILVIADPERFCQTIIDASRNEENVSFVVSNCILEC